MKLAVWQPYFFPYIGYFQAVNAVDAFCFFDDVNFIKKGFIHRNSLLVNKTPFQFSVPLLNASQNRLIIDTKLAEAYPAWKKSFFELLRHNYGKSPRFNGVMELIQEALVGDTISSIAEKSVVHTAEYLGLAVKFSRSSSYDYDRGRSAQEKVIQLANLHHASEVLNPIGGRALYNPADFEQNGLVIRFFEMNEPSLNKQFGDGLAKLSILHWLFNFDADTIKQALLEVQIHA
jgi:hypothetical protein